MVSRRWQLEGSIRRRKNREVTVVVLMSLAAFANQKHVMAAVRWQRIDGGAGGSHKGGEMLMKSGG